MAAEISELSEDALVEKYFKERGFEVIEGLPPENAEVPFFLLQEPQKYMDRSSMEFHYTKYGSKTQCWGVLCHPLRSAPEKLISIIEQMAGFLHRDKNPNVVHPKQGRKFPVYIADPAWKSVVDILIEKYSDSKI